MTFRTDINGLRALAVIAVTLFHFNETLLPGGFIGVDIFFVISGFLMTKIIINGLNNHTFSLKVFYTARAVRIIPPLAALCLCLLIFGWFFLTPMDYRQVGNDVLNSMLFVSNFIYAQDKGYFDTSSSEEWLLHTWSLSVEWQFYIIYPLILLGIYKLFGQHKTNIFIIAATFLSFITCLVWTKIAPTSSYFLLPTRAWEMLMGGIAFLYPLSHKKNHRALPWFGISIILFSAFCINKTDLWPSYLTLIPILGTYLVIVSNQKNALLDNKPMQYIGSWSYSIYLWHWVIVTIGSYLNLNNWIYIGLLLSVFFGGLSFQIIELRKRTLSPLTLVVVLCLLSALIHKTNGIFEHYSDEVQSIYNETEYKPIDCNVKDGYGCKYINNNKVKNNGYADYILLGDSHAETQLYTILNSIEENKSLIYINTSGCLYIPDIKANRELSQCTNSINYVYDNLIPNNNRSTLIFVQRTNIYFQPYLKDEVKNPYQDIRNMQDISSNNSVKSHYISTLCELNKKLDVIITKPTPELPFNAPHQLVKSILLKNKGFSENLSLDELNNRNKPTNELFQKLTQCGISVLDPIPYLCNNDYCPFEINNNLIYRDDDHLSSFGSSLLSKMWASNLKK